jgi:predicted metal-dependent phosphoesterase TrpH
MKIDIHIHSSYSNDGSVAPNEILRYAKKIKLHGVAITDHNELKGSLRLWKENKADKDFLVIPAMEVSTSEGHVLAMGITEPVSKDLSPEMTIEKVSSLGGVAIASHPYRFWSGLGEENVRRAKFEVVEVVNSRSLKKENQRATKLADEMGAGKTGGSDCHSLEHMGHAYTLIDNPVYDCDDFLEVIRKGQSKGEGEYRKFSGTPKYAASCVYLWLKRGMKKI